MSSPDGAELTPCPPERGKGEIKCMRVRESVYVCEKKTREWTSVCIIVNVYAD